MIRARGIKKRYDGLEVLKGIDLDIASFQLLALVGSSGAGKTSLLQILGTLDKPSEGTVEINGQDVSLLKGNKLSFFRNKNIGFVFQFHNLLPEFTALENVCIPGYIGRRSQKEVQNDAFEILERLSITDRAHHKPAEMSGGEQQRVAVARALVNHPNIVFADEPSGNLDTTNAKQLHLLFKELTEELKTTFVVVTHNKELAQLSDTVVEIKDGLLI